jgi:hypothetical protein
MNMDESSNRANRYGPMGGWEYTPAEFKIDPKTGKETLVKPPSQKWVSTDEGMTAAKERMSRRLAGEGFENYESPKQVSAITDALMATRMNKMGLLENKDQGLMQSDYGQRMADNRGGYASGQLPPAGQPPIPPPAGQPPAGQPPIPPPATGQPPNVPVGPPASGGNRPIAPTQPHSISKEDMLRMLSGGR